MAAPLSSNSNPSSPADAELSWFARNISEPFKLRCVPPRSAGVNLYAYVPISFISAFASRKLSLLSGPPSVLPPAQQLVRSFEHLHLNPLAEFNLLAQTNLVRLGMIT